MKYHKMVMLSVCCSQAESTEEARSKRRRLEAWAEGSPMVLMVAGARLHVDPKQHLGSIGGFFRGTGGMTPHCWHHQAYRRKDVDRQPKLCRNYVSFGEPSLQAAFRPRKWKRTEKEMKRRWKKQNGTKRIYCFSFPFFFQSVSIPAIPAFDFDRWPDEGQQSASAAAMGDALL
jgi:hypothetical protein